ncbi:MAG: PAS domain S-box protein [Chloroflexi bacterium]|nr:PAS domain S-box protein [Chloroflexota bacterium]
MRFVHSSAKFQVKILRAGLLVMGVSLVLAIAAGLGVERLDALTQASEQLARHPGYGQLVLNGSTHAVPAELSRAWMERAQTLALDLGANGGLVAAAMRLVVSAVLAAMMVRVRASQHALHQELEQKFQARTAELETERNLMRTLIDNMPDMIYAKDRDSKFILANVATAQSMGVAAPADLLGKSDFDFHPRALAEEFRADEVSLMTQGVPLVNKQEFVIMPGGQTVYLSSTKVPLRNAAGQVIGLVGIDRDVSTARAREEQYRRIVENAHEGIVTTNADHTIVFHNARAAEILGYASDELLGQTPLLIAAPQDRETAQTRLQQRREGLRGEGDYPFIRKGGKEGWMHVIATPIRDDFENYAGTLYMFTDITEHKQAEDALSASESLYRSLVEAMPQCITRKDRAGRFIFGNSSFFQDMHRTPEQILGKRDFDLFPPDLTEKYRRDDLRVLQTGETLDVMEEHLRGDGKRILVRVIKSPTYGADGAINGLQVMYWDITASQQQQEQLRQLSRAVEASSSSIVITNVEGVIEYANPAFTAVTGYSLAEITGENARLLKSGHTSPEEYATLWKTIKSGNVWRGEFLNRKKNGELHWEYVSISPVPNELGVITHFVAVKEDITARKQAEERLRRQNEYLDALHETTLGLIGRLQLNELLQALTLRAATLVGTAHGYSYVNEHGRAEMEMNVGIGIFEKMIGTKAYLGTGLTGLVWQTGEPLILDAYQTWEGHLAKPGYEELHSIVAIPLKSGAQVVGVFGVAYTDAQRHFDETDVAILTRFAHLASIALDNARLYETQRVAREQAEKLLAATLALGATLDLQQVFELILKELQQIVPFDSASVQELKGDYLEVIGGVGFENLPDVLGVRFDVVKGHNPNVKVIANRRPLILNNISAQGYSNFQNGTYQVTEINSWLGVPLLFGDRIIGMITLDKKEPGFYTPEHARLALAFAAQAAVAIENARLYAASQAELRERKRAEEALQRRADEFAALYEISKELATPTEVAGLLETIVTRARELLHAPVGGMQFYEPERGDLELVVAQGSSAQRGTRQQMGEGVVGRVAQTRQPLISDDYQSSPKRLAEYAALNFRAMLHVPMVYSGELIGVLNLAEVGESTRKFTEADLRLLSLFAAQAASAVHNVRLFEKMQTALVVREQSEAALRRQTTRLRAAAELGRAVTAILEIDQVLPQVAALIGEYFGYYHVGLFLIDETGQWAVLHGDNRALPRPLLDSDLRLPVGAPTSIIGYVTGSGQLHIADDVTTDPYYYYDDTLPDVRSEAVFPLIASGKLIGALDVASAKTSAFTADDVSILSLIADQTAVAIQNARLYAAAQQALQETQNALKQVEAAQQRLNLQYEIARILADAVTLDQATPRLLEIICRTLDWQSGEIWQCDDAAGVFQCVDIWHDGSDGFAEFENKTRGVVFGPHEGMMHSIFVAGAPISIVEVARDPHFKMKDEAARAGIHSAFGCPLWSGAKIIGIACFFSNMTRVVTADEENIVTTIARQIGQFIERKQAEAALARERTMLRTIIDAIPDYVYAKDRASRFTLANEAVARHFGNTDTAEMIGKSDFDLATPELAQQYLAYEQVLFETGQPRINYEETFFDESEHRRRWVLTTKVPLRDVSGNVIGLVGVNHDITDIKQAQAALAESEAKYRRIVETAQEGMMTTDAENKVVYINPRGAQIFGYPPEELLGRNPVQYLRPDFLAAAEARVQARRQGLQTESDLVIIRKDGVEAWLHSLGTPIRDEADQYAGTLYMFTDITARRAAEKAIAYERDLLQALMDNIPDLIFFKDRASRIVRSNLAHLRNLGAGDMLQVLGKTDYDFHAGEAADRSMADEQKIIETGMPLLNQLESDPAPDGSARWFSTTKVPWRDPDGKILGTLGISHDVTHRILTQQHLEAEIVERQSAMELLREREELLSRVLDTVEDGIYIVDKQGKMTFSNRATKRIIGATHEEIAASVYNDAHWQITTLDGEPFPKAEQPYSRVMATGEPVYNVEQSIRRPDGTRVTVSINAAPLHGAQGQVIGEVAAMSDITERKRAEQELHRQKELLQTVFDHIPVMIGVFDANGEYTLVNHEWEQTLGYALAEMNQSNVMAAMYPEPESLERARQFMFEPTPGWRDFRTVVHDARALDTSWAYTRLSDGRTIAFGQDITKRKEVERLKNEFISTVSHELRTPLTAIRGSLGLIAGGVAGALPERARSMVDIAYKNSERLVRLINDILDIEKIESGKMVFQIQPLELMPLVEQAIEANRAYAEQYHVSFVVSSGVLGALIHADADRITQVLTNLLSNAAKFSPPGGQVEISVQRNANGIRVGVRDHGPGIPLEFQSRIFQKFAQADSSDARQKGGTGLGLSIVKAIVEKHGGTIGFDTTPGVGTLFYFELPEWHAPAPPEPAPASVKPRILICEDDRDVALLLSMMLKQGGFETDVAYNAAQAQALLQQFKYTALTLDLMLPDKDGITLIRELRAAEATRGLPIVVVSAKAEQGRKLLNGDAIWVADWLQKPIDQAHLVRAVVHAAERTDHGTPRILHVEDDEDVAQVIEAILHDTAEVSAARSLAQARALLLTHTYDLVILDPSLPDGSGAELLPLLRRKTGQIPVVLFSAHDNEPEMMRQVSAALVKSRTSNEELLATIAELIRASKPELKGAPT